MSQSQRQHPNRWEKIVALLSPEHYEKMKNRAEVLMIESARYSAHVAAAELYLPLPQVEVEVAAAEVYRPLPLPPMEVAAAEIHRRLPPPPVPSKKRNLWTEEEHRLFLTGLRKYGHRDLKNIANHVGTRTPSQVASHAQKYFIRHNTHNTSTKRRKRKSIHDIPLMKSDHGLVPHPTGQYNLVTHQNGEHFQNRDEVLMIESRYSDHVPETEVHHPLPPPPIEEAAAEVHRPLPSPPIPTKQRKAWTEEEHKSFLIGLCKYGRRDWKNIARQCVVTRTPSQVASHAQKYFIHQNASTNQRKRKSIHDILLMESDLGLVPQHTAHYNLVNSHHQYHHVHEHDLALPSSNVHVDGLHQTSKAHAIANSFFSPDVATQQQLEQLLQAQELQEAQESQQGQEIFYMDPPNILPQQIDEFGNFNNCLN